MPEYSPDDRRRIVTEICDAISEGALVIDECKKRSVARESFRVWYNAEPDLLAMYTRARESQAHSLAEETLSLADSAIGGKDGDTDKVRLQVDTRKWYTSKIAAKLYGDRTQTEHTGPDGGDITIRVVRDTITPNE